MLMDKEGVTQSSAIERDEFGRPMWVYLINFYQAGLER